MNDKELDRLISANLKAMIDAPVPVDTEKSWQDFEKRISKQDSDKTSAHKNRYSKYYKLALVSALVLIITTVAMPKEVIGFKYEFFKWFSKNGSGETIITEKTNPSIKPGKYNDLNFEEAKAMITFQLKYPTYLPEGFTSNPKVSLQSTADTIALVTITFQNNNKFIILKQENGIPEEIKNRYVPNNAKIENLSIDENIEVILISDEKGFQAMWKQNGVNYNLVAIGLEKEEVLKIIKCY